MDEKNKKYKAYRKEITRWTNMVRGMDVLLDLAYQKGRSPIWQLYKIQSILERKVEEVIAQGPG